LSLIKHNSAKLIIHQNLNHRQKKPNNNNSEFHLDHSEVGSIGVFCDFQNPANLDPIKIILFFLFTYSHGFFLGIYSKPFEYKIVFNR